MLDFKSKITSDNLVRNAVRAQAFARAMSSISALSRQRGQPQSAVPLSHMRPMSKAELDAACKGNVGSALTYPEGFEPRGSLRVHQVLQMFDPATVSAV